MRLIAWLAIAGAGLIVPGAADDVLSLALLGTLLWGILWRLTPARPAETRAASRRETLVVALLLGLCALPELAQLLLGSGLAASARGRLHLGWSLAGIPIVLLTTLKQSPTTYTLVAQAAWHLVLGLPALVDGIARLALSTRSSAWDPRTLGDSLNLQIIRDILPLALSGVLALLTLGAWCQEYLRRDHPMSPAWSALFATQTALALLLLRGTLPLTAPP
jgi:hypothetical protein